MRSRWRGRGWAKTAVPEPFDLPKDDPRVYEMIASADTVGMFQLESSGQRNLSTRLKSSTFEDIIAQISLFRPGPLEAEMITPFIRRRHGLEPVEVPHEGMREVLADSYGVIVYQEQVLLVARAVAGFGLAEADSLRRAMTKGRSREEMERIRGHFLRRAAENGVEHEVAAEVFRQLEGFAAYGFNKAHAACFAVVSYATAWLRTYYPAEFAAAILNNEPMGFYTPRLVVNDARRHGIEILPPHVNESRARYTVEHDGRAIRVGLRDLHRMTARLLGRDRARAGGAALPRPRRLPATHACRDRSGRVARARRSARRARHHRGGSPAHARRAARAAARDQGGAGARRAWRATTRCASHPLPRARPRTRRTSADGVQRGGSRRSSSSRGSR